MVLVRDGHLSDDAAVNAQVGPRNVKGPVSGEAHLAELVPLGSIPDESSLGRGIDPEAPLLP